MMMLFSFQESDDLYVGELIYIISEQTLLFNPFCTHAGFSIMISGAYTSLDVDQINCEVKHISGCNPKHLWISKKLDTPSSKRGKLLVQFETQVEPGTGEDYATDWKTYHDTSKNMICIGNPAINDSDVCIEFASGISAVLRGRNLIAVWAKIREVESI